MCCIAFGPLVQAYLVLLSEARHFFSRSLRRRSLSSRHSVRVAVFQFLKRVRVYASSRALFDGVACLPVCVSYMQQHFSMCMLDKLNSPVCRRMRLEKSLVWTPFSAVRSLVPRLLLPTWPYRGSRTGTALLEVLAPRVRDASPWS